MTFVQSWATKMPQLFFFFFFFFFVTFIGWAILPPKQWLIIDIVNYFATHSFYPPHPFLAPLGDTTPAIFTHDFLSQTSFKVLHRTLRSHPKTRSGVSFNRHSPFTIHFFVFLEYTFVNFEAQLDTLASLKICFLGWLDLEVGSAPATGRP